MVSQAQEPEQRADTNQPCGYRGLKAGDSSGPGRASLPLGFCLNGVLNTNRFTVCFKELVCSVGKVKRSPVCLHLISYFSGR